MQQKSSGTYIRGMEILAAASEFAEHLGVANFKAVMGSCGAFANAMAFLLLRFRVR